MTVQERHDEDDDDDDVEAAYLPVSKYERVA